MLPRAMRWRSPPSLTKRHMNPQAERSNFLRQCWRTGRWKDGVGTLLFPLRMSLYQWRRNASAQRSRKRNGEAIPATRLAAPIPAFSPDVHSIFFEAGAGADAKVDLRDVPPRPMRSCAAFTASGGRCDRFDPDTVEVRADSEDVNHFTGSIGRAAMPSLPPSGMQPRRKHCSRLAAVVG